MPPGRRPRLARFRQASGLIPFAFPARQRIHDESQIGPALFRARRRGIAKICYQE
jgi:hypothetical protein